MELRHLRYFTAVAETGSLSRAAEKLFIAQPPLSVQIRQLEEELGQPLFTRHPRGVRLTTAGQALLPEARHLVDRAARIAEVVRSAGQGPAGHLSVGYVPSASSTVLPVLLRQLRRAHPGLQLELREMISAEQVDALAAGQIDAGIARTPTRHPRLAVASRMPDAFCLAVPAAQARTLLGVVDLRQFADADFVAFTRHRGPAYFDQSIRLCSQAGFNPHLRYEATTVHGVLDLVSAELGVALVPASTALLGVKGVAVRRLRKQGAAEVLALLRRKVDPNPLMPVLESTMETIFADLTVRVARATAGQTSSSGGSGS
jgi:DNA-binding transcriptional LysR family regulator